MTDTIKAQIENIRRGGESNMFDAKAVFEIAVRDGYSELADYIFSYTPQYSKYILTGECEND